MKKILFALILIALFLTACGPAMPDPTPGTSAPITFPKIDRYPATADYSGINKYSSIPKYDPNSQNPFQMDLRSADLSNLDLSQSRDDLFYAIFDSQTVWPAADKMPADFDWRAIMETGKNPGLGVRKLHEQEITGKGVGIAIIDQPLLVDHQEYAQQIRLYEEINLPSQREAQMHAPAVASIAVGKTIGVAPEADLYFFATLPRVFDNQGNPNYDFTDFAQAMQRVMEINAQLPAERKIRAISLSYGWFEKDKGYAEITAAVNKARRAGMLVIYSDPKAFLGAGRAPLRDPDDFQAYEPGLLWAVRFYANPVLGIPLLVPMDSRTTASPTGKDEYVFYREGGMSWAIPYIAGMYALAAQVDPAITPDKFWKLVMETGQTIEINHEGKTYQLGPILDPAALIAALKH